MKKFCISILIFLLFASISWAIPPAPIPPIRTTDCSVFIADGVICYDIDDDKFYVGNGTSAIELTNMGNSIFPNTGLRIYDTNASHYLTIAPGSNITGNKTLTLTTGDADRTITLSGNPTLADWFDQAVKTTSTPIFPTIYGSSAADGDITIEGTSSATKTTSYVILQPTGGNVGIGTTGPTTKLDVRGGGGTILLNTPSSGVFSASVTALSGGYLFGFGTTNIPLLVTSENTAAQNIGGGIGFGGKYNTATNVVVTYAGILGAKEAAGDGNDAGYLAFGTKELADYIKERMRITGGGNVGIGTTAPTSILSFPSTGSPTISVATEDGSDDGALSISGGGTLSSARGGFIKLYGNEYPGAGGRIQFGAGNVNATGHIELSTQGLERVRIDYSGNVGINTATFGTSAANVLGIGSGTAPTTSPIDMAQFWVADVSNGTAQAGLHILSEDGVRQIIGGGGVHVLNYGTLGSESLNETGFTTHAKWDVAGGFDDTGGAAIYTHAGGTGTLTQTSGNLAITVRANRWYKLVYPVSSVTAGCTAVLTTGIATTQQTLTLAAGTQTLYFLSAVSPGNFVISVTSTGGGFTLDDISLKEVQGGNVYVGGNLYLGKSDTTTTNAYVVGGGQAATTKNTGWAPIYVNGTLSWIPYWSNATP